MDTAKIPDVSLLGLSRKGYMEAAGVLAQHEAAHAVAALYIGYGVTSATIALDALDGGGLVKLDGTNDLGLGHVLVHMAGPIGTGDEVKWRPLPVGTGDEESLALLVDFLGMTEDDWNDAVRMAREILSFPHVARAWRAISGALYDHGTVDGAELKRLFDEAA